jgi:Mg2+ and Co2+ transporter CorA
MKLLTQYEQVTEQHDLKEHAASSARDYFDLLTATTPLHRAVANMQIVLQEARSAARDDRQLIVARDKAYEIMRRTELITGDVKYGLDYAIAHRAEQQALNSQHMATSAHRLNVLAAFFFPIATLTALFGVNLKTGLEETASPWLFLGVIAVGVIMGLVLSKLVIVKPGGKQLP